MRFFSVFILVLGLGSFSNAETVPLLKSGDRIALVGNTLIERARLFGHLESAILLAGGDQVSGLVIRNFGWSADSVFGDSRSYFGSPEEGRNRLQKSLSTMRPNLVFLSYGTGEAMSVDQGWTNEAAASQASAGGLEESLAIFLSEYKELIHRVRDASGPELRNIVLLSPPPLENRGGDFPDQTSNNKRIAQFRDAIHNLAVEEKLCFVDLFGAMGGDELDGTITDTPLTVNGVHFTSNGYRDLSRKMVQELGYQETAITSIEPQAYETLREAVVEKNRLFFHRWRPANETYLFLFRKHEQGQNAKEIPAFDPLIQKQEQAVETARLQAIATKATK